MDAEQAVNEGRRGTLKVTGVVRGAPFSADRLVHLQTYGDFAIHRITAAPPLRPRGPQGDGSMDVEAPVLSEPGPEKDDLVGVNEVDDMANEQTWPTEDEMHGAGYPRQSAEEENEDGAAAVVPDSALQTSAKAIRRVPKGTSAYQAAWILEDEEIDSDGDEGEDTGNDEDERTEDDGAANQKEFQFEAMSVDGKEADTKIEVEEKEEYEDIAEEDEQTSKAVAFEDMDMEEEKRQ